jgi:filamentous hemagglutinin family protein
VSAAINSAQQAAQAAQQSASALTRATLAIQATQAAQAAAHNLALSASSSVPNGLAPGGLVVDPRVVAGTDPNLWINASLPAQSTTNGVTTVTIAQTAPRAVMTWEQFNVGKNTILKFDQSGGNSANGNNWVALNRIDASGVPSQIEGQIKAQGTVLIINPNGIVFNGSSQINVHTLIASSLDINAFNSAKVGVFSQNANYVPVTVNGVNQVAANGNTLMAPPTEDNGNTSFVSSGLYASNNSSLLIMSSGLIPGQTNQGVIVQAGAIISTDISGFDNGGYVALLGPQVSNAGLITAPAGQIILAAGNDPLNNGQPNVYLSQPGGNGTAVSVSSTSPTTDQAITTGAVMNGLGVVINQAGGLLSSPRGNITLLADDVSQLGVAEAITSITRAGTFNITANNLLTFGPNSVTAILPAENGETIPLNSLSAFVPPSITINAANVDLQGSQNGNQGSLIAAPGASINAVSATAFNPSAPSLSPTGRFLMESGSVIDLAGLDATASVANYLYTFKVTANDVADSPLAQSLIGQTVTIDLRLSGTRSDGLAWVGSPLFSSTGAAYLTSVPQSIDQLLTKGGSLSFNSTSSGFQPFYDVLQAPGAILNIAGGVLSFTGAIVNTTRLVGGDGRIYAIGSAQPTVGYSGIAGSFTVDHAHWNVEDVYSNALLSGRYFDPGYVDGASGGSISVNAVNPVLEGTMLADTYLGSRQGRLNQIGNGTNNAQLTPDQLPVGSALSITTLLGSVFNLGVDAIVLQNAPSDVLGTDFTMTSGFTLPTVTLLTQIKPGGNVTMPSGVLVYSTDELSASGFGSISISSTSEISMAKGATLSVQDGGTIKLTGVSTLDGTLNARSGKIIISGYSGGTFILNVPPTPQLTIGPDAVINVSGLWINDTGANANTAHGPAYTNGGSVTIQTFAEGSSVNGTIYVTNGLVTADTTQSIVLAPGSTIDVTSGGYVQPSGKVLTGATGLPSGVGGNLSLLTYVANNGNSGWLNPIPSQSGAVIQNGNVAPNNGNEPNQANVFIGGTIYSGGLSGGGTFALQAPSVQVGGVSTVTSYDPSSARAGEIDLPASFFAGNGFSSYALTSTYGDVAVAAGTQVVLNQRTYVLPTSALPSTGVSLRNFASLALLPATLRPVVNLSLTELPYAYGGLNDVSTNAGVLVDAGASISGDPGASIALTAGGPVTVLGSIRTRGGSISLTNNGIPEDLSQLPQGNSLGTGVTQAPLDIWIGPNAVLDVSGIFRLNLQVSAYRTGSVLPGGSITLSGGSIFAMPGSLFNLAGANAMVQVPQSRGAFGLPGLAVQSIWSNGGILTLFGDATSAQFQTGLYQNAFFDGTINAAAGAPQAAGGTLNVGEVFSGGAGYGAVIVQQGGSMTALLNPSALPTPGAAYPTSSAQLASLLPNTNGYAYVSANTLNNSGLDSVTLMGGTIAFSGNVTVNLPDRLTLAGKINLLAGGNLDPTQNPASVGKTVVNLNAGYVLMVSGSAVTPHLSDGTLNVNATTQIDLAGPLSISNAANVNLSAGGDIRFLAEADPEFSAGVFGSSGYFSFNPVKSSQNLQQYDGMLSVPDNLTLTAREVYPSTDAGFLLISTAQASGPGTINTITIASNGRSPVAPLSANGQILIDAQSIVQSGVLLAPLGAIELGLNSGQIIPASLKAFSVPTVVPTASLTLTPGSITSVSAAGLQIPYGVTVNDANWTTFLTQTGNGAPLLTAPPSKAVLLNGATVNSMAGAVVDLSGGGDIYAAEFVPGSGGSRNVLTGAGSGQTVYALVPGYSAAVAAYDPLFGQAVTAGTSVTLAGGNGIAAGTYTLLPAIYATLPGAYRVVVSSTSSTIRSANIGPDGTFYTTGVLGSSIAGTRAAQPVLLQIQSSAVWSRYSEIDITHGNSYFAKLAATNGTVTPPLPIDGGVLTINATSALNLQSVYNFTPAPGGRGGEAAITGTNLLVLAADQSEPAADVSPGYIVLNSDQLSNLGATTLLLGGTSTLGAAGLVVTATATSLEVDTDAAHQLSAPELLLVTLAKSGANGLTVDAGSVISAVGSVPMGTDTNITVGTGTAATASGSLLRVSNGQPVTITRTGATATGAGFAIGTTPGSATIPATPGAPVIINGGVSLTLDSSGSGTLAANAVLNARNYLLSASQINLGNVPAGTAGLTISPQLIAQFGGANALTLRSASVFDFYDTGLGGVSLGTTNPIGTLTLDGSGLYSNGGTTVIAANNIDLVDSQATPNAANALPAVGGTLAISAGGVVTMDSGAKTLGNFATIGITAGQQIVFNGTGSITAGTSSSPAAVTLTAPQIVAAGASSQSLTTFGALNLQAEAGMAPAVPVTNIGGALTFTAANITDTANIVALAGQLNLNATSGDIVLDAGARIVATGSHIPLFDLTQDAPGGTVKLTASAGNVTINPGATIDVSATGTGYAGTLSITTASTNTATLNGTLIGGAAYNDIGGNFVLNAGSLVGSLPFNSGFTGSFNVTLQQGDVAVPAGVTLSSGQVTLTANTGSVVVNGTIDASGPTGGAISLYGAGTGSTSTGVLIGPSASLLAAYRADDSNDPAYGNGESTLVQNGGVITLSATGASDGTLNLAYGYENVLTSGAISVAAGAVFNVSGVPGGANISNVGGQVILRAPILKDGTTNIHFHGTLVTNADANGNPTGNGVVADAYAVWSTTDGCTNGACAAVSSATPFASLTPAQQAGLASHFDGIIDPAGWFYLNGNTLTQVSGSTPAGSDIFTPTGTAGLGGNSVYMPHVLFYGTTLVNFVQSFNPSVDFSGAQLQVGGSIAALPSSMQHQRPEIDLVNPSTAATGNINGGNITVASNWNLGAGGFNGNGTYAPVCRTTGGTDAGEPGVLMLRAANTVQINATLSDGFYESSDAFGGAVLVANQIANNPQMSGVVADYNTTSAENLMSIVAGVNDGSFSYDFVGGAAFSGSGGMPANPNAVVAATGTTKGTNPNLSVTVNGHTSYASLNSFVGKTPSKPTIDIPTLVRTGTGSITIAAAGSFELLDTAAPGVVYTAGAATTALPSGFTAPVMPTPSGVSTNGLVSTPTWATGGGSLTINVGVDIVGIESPVDDSSGSQTFIKNGPNGEFWTTWYYRAGKSTGQQFTPFAPGLGGLQNSTWINYGTFFQGVGALGGGNVTLRAGIDIDDISASLPETIQVSGGQFVSGPAAAAHYYGGGDLVVAAGGNLYGSTFFVGRGTGSIVAGATIATDPLNPVTGKATTYQDVRTGTLLASLEPLPLLLAVQDSFISVTAGQSVSLGGTFDPTELPQNLSRLDTPSVGRSCRRVSVRCFTAMALTVAFRSKASSAVSGSKH